MRDGSPQLWFIAGEPGIGKTRLAAELATAVHGDGGAVQYGRAYPEALTPYQPFAEALGVSRFTDLVEGATATATRCSTRSPRSSRARPGRS